MSVLRQVRSFFYFPLIAFLLVPYHIAQSCGPSNVQFYGYSFINPAIINTDATFTPFLLRFDDFYKNISNKKQAQLIDNVTEWTDRFCDLVKPKDVEYLIYKSSIRDLELLKTAIKSKTIGLPGSLSLNSFARHMESHKCLETVNYLIFAKNCEPHVTRQDSWEPVARDTVAMNELIKKGKKKFKKIDSHYIKLRYAYQLIRLAHYKKNYKQVLILYDELLPLIDANPSILDHWILGHKAGALYQLGNRTEAAYLYSLIFRECPSKREAAYQSFSLKTQNEWNECLLKCQNDTERATLYLIRSSGKNSRAAKDMERIYELDPNNAHLDILLVKEVRKLEKNLLGLEFNHEKKTNKRHFKIPQKQINQYLIEVQRFVELVVKENIIKNIELWKIADAYLEFLAGDYYASQLTFSKIKDSISNEILKDQVHAFELALQIAMFKNIEDEEERAISEIVKNDPTYEKYKDFHNYLFDKLAYDYAHNDHLGKAFRCLHSLDELRYNPKLNIVDNLLAICQKESRNPLENALVSDKNGDFMENSLLEIRGTYYLNRFQLETAIQILKQIRRADRVEYEYNPFRDEINDCVHCPMPNDTMRYDKVGLIEKILELDFQGRAQLDMGALSFYKTGLAYYNTTYYGNCWHATDFFRSGANWRYRNEDNVYPLTGFPFGNRENKDCTMALYYFEKAFLLAKKRELAARAAFMAAKCEQNMWYNTKECKQSYYSKNIPNVPDEYRRFFKILKDEYQDTEFYGQAIQECKYFRAYALK